jgi:hypothetical protein
LGEGYGPGGDRLFRRVSGSTMGAEGFHGRVRDGIGCLAPRYGHQANGMRRREVSGPRAGFGAARGRWCGLVAQPWAKKPIERLVPVSCGDCSLSTSGLSTWWSSTALGETWF